MPQGFSFYIYEGLDFFLPEFFKPEQLHEVWCDLWTALGPSHQTISEGFKFPQSRTNHKFFGGLLLLLELMGHLAHTTDLAKASLFVVPTVWLFLELKQTEQAVA